MSDLRVSPAGRPTAVRYSALYGAVSLGYEGIIEPLTNPTRHVGHGQPRAAHRYGVLLPRADTRAGWFQTSQRSTGRRVGGGDVDRT
jgi:hypothetical protein